MSTTVDFAHAMLHAGEFFKAYAVAELAAGQVLEVAMKPAASGTTCGRVHLAMVAKAEDVAEFQIVKGVTLASGGVDFTPVNSNENSSKVSTLQGLKVGTPGGTPLSWTGGTTRWVEPIAIAHNQAGASTFGSEYMPAANVWTVFRIVSGAASNTCWIGLYWYQTD